ncbi:Hypothetical protein D9617_20g027830 [Elsinoe fawcettii]|nr:Hypothetical protein D9617_20g027830 [Elsinoe fawcettii]
MRVSAQPRAVPRIMYYHQTHYRKDGSFVSILPILKIAPSVTNVIIAALHLNHPERGELLLNDDPWDSNRAHRVWQEARILQTAGIQVSAMLGGADLGSFFKLDGDKQSFEQHYAPLKGMLEATNLDGLDIDVEESMSMGGIIRLVDRLATDFGLDFLITLAPVATAMYGSLNMSGFDYEVLEKGLGSKIAWYNTQFYCGWGSLKDTDDYDKIVLRGWDPARIVAGLITNPDICEGWVGDEEIRKTLMALIKKYPTFAGVMGWEYAESVTEAHPDRGEPWRWAEFMGDIMRSARTEPRQ